jgi:hypothetical protein
LQFFRFQISHAGNFAFNHVFGHSSSPVLRYGDCLRIDAFRQVSKESSPLISTDNTDQKANLTTQARRHGGIAKLVIAKIEKPKPPRPLFLCVSKVLGLSFLLFSASPW